jgi:asparagine synthetase B (glutamine-hydrolysing)
LARRAWRGVIADDAESVLRNRAAEELEYWGTLTPSRHFIDESNFTGLMVENTHSVTIAGDLPAMATAVEIRSPFLDPDMVEFALATPADLKIDRGAHGATLKAILREAVRDCYVRQLGHLGQSKLSELSTLLKIILSQATSEPKAMQPHELGPSKHASH